MAQPIRAVVLVRVISAVGAIVSVTEN
jgi:hypothetical protein